MFITFGFVDRKEIREIEVVSPYHSISFENVASTNVNDIYITIKESSEEIDRPTS